ncbi:MAG: (d)CMP kinase [Actinomycetes bacterium]|nr:MAG: (d)CMP kinase [Actinomycetota bacterium]
MPIVTIDGPSGTGKSTVTRAIADRFALPFLDTGAFYRAATLAVLEAGVAPEDGPAVIEVVKGITIDQKYGVTYLDGRDVSERIRDADVTGAVSAVSAHPEVRRMMVERQREWVEAEGGSAIVEGRDIGSVVFPDAEVKIYLDARPEVRAMRRAMESGEDPRTVAAAIERRDRYDSTRAVAPLTVPEGAVVIDTSDLAFDEVVEEVSRLVAAKS